MYLYPGTVPRPPAQQHNESQQFFHRFHGFTFIFCYWFWIVTTHTTQQPTTNKRQTTTTLPTTLPDEPIGLL